MVEVHWGIVAIVEGGEIWDLILRLRASGSRAEPSLPASD